MVVIQIGTEETSASLVFMWGILNLDAMVKPVVAFDVDGNSEAIVHG